MTKTSRAILSLFLPLVLLAQDKPTIAVLEFDGFGLSGPEIQTLTNRLRTNMTQLGVYRVIERGLMQQILMEQDFDTYLTLLDDYNRDTDIEVALQNFTYFSRLYYHPIRLISIGLNDCL